MPRSLRQVIAELRARMEQLASQRDEAVAAQAALSQEKDDLQQQLEECRERLKEARMEVDFLTVSHRLADTPANLIAARRRMQRLIAKIDRCVSLLKEDADIS